MLIKFQRMWDGHLGRINVAEHIINLLNDEMRPVYSTPYRAEPTARKCSEAGINQMIAENVIERATTEWAALTLHG